MKRILPFVLLIVIAAGFFGCQKKSANIIYDKKYIDEIKEVRREVAFYMASNFIPGSTFAIAKDGKLIYSEAFGQASKDLDVKMDRSHKTRIGDISELLTNIMYQKLVEEGVLHPDSSIQHYMPDFPAKESEITLSHLVNHTSGIRNLKNSELNWSALNVTIQKGLENFKNDTLMYPPGWFQELSIYNYNLLGALMENATGKKFHELLAEYVTDTLKLSNTVVDNPFVTIKGRTDYYDHNIVSQVVNASFRDVRYRAPSQGMLSNAEDLVKFGIAILHSDYISEDLRKDLFEPVTLLYNNSKAGIANGWMLLNDQKGRNIYGRGGKVTGGGAALLIYPEEDLVVAGTINLTSDIDDIPVFKLAKMFVADEENMSETNN